MANDTNSITVTGKVRKVEMRDRSVEILLPQLAALRWNRLQRVLEPALEVEPERRLVADRRPRDGHRRHRDERGDDERDDDEGRPAGH